eukprot:3852922-Pyramimonas_sp.AAC.1
MCLTQIHRRTIRYGYIPAFFSHLTYDPTAANRPVAPHLDSAMFSDCYAQPTGVPRVGSQTENPHVRETADDLYRSQLTRGAGDEAGVHGQVPRC